MRVTGAEVAPSLMEKWSLWTRLLSASLGCMTAPATNDGIEILIDGFFDNPVLAWVFQDESTRARAIETWFRFWVKSYGEQGRLIVADGGDGAALWATPEVPPVGSGDTAGLIEIVREYNGERTGFVLGALAAVKAPTDAHWYLNGIAARRGERSRGVGARLIEPFLERSDADGIPIYLESSNPRNLSFYRRYGFEDYGPRIDLPESGPRLQPMLRPPRSLG